MLKNLFGKKKDGFYMQVDESNPTTAKPAAEKKAEPVKDKSATPESAVVVADIPGEVVSETPAPAAKAKNSKTSVKEKKSKDKEDKKAKDQSTSQPVAPVASATAPMLPAMTNFATDYLIKPSSTSSRRRPGANMKGFVTMAREVKK